MKHTITTLALTLALTGSVQAEGFPIRDRDHGRGSAPYGYTRSGNSFVPTDPERSRPAIPRERGEACPYGFNPSGSACVSTR